MQTINTKKPPYTLCIVVSELSCHYLTYYILSYYITCFTQKEFATTLVKYSQITNDTMMDKCVCINKGLYIKKKSRAWMCIFVEKG